MTKLSTIIEVFLTIVLIFSLVTFTWAIVDTTSSISAIPVLNTDLLEKAVSVAVEPIADAPVVDFSPVENEHEPESKTLVTFTPPKYNKQTYLSNTRNIKDKIEDEGDARVILSFDNAEDMEFVEEILNNLNAEIHTEWSDGLAVTADANTMAAIVDSNAVAMIEEDLPLQTMTYEGYDLIDLEKVLANDILTLDNAYVPTTQNLTASGIYSLTGAGQTVVIIDSGISVTHQEFDGKVLYEWDFDGITQIDKENAEDEWNHGTKMAGVISAKGVNMDGIAPAADIVNLRITNATGGGFRSYLYQALDWVSNNASQYNITTIYIGVGDGLYNGTESDCDDSFVYLKINELINNNITVIAPSGHDGNTTMIAYPACVANTISVGAVTEGKGYPADQWNLTGVGGVQSNRRNGLLDLLAPGGVGETKTTNVSNYDARGDIGTSVSAAYVAGASILLREYWDARNWDYSPSGLVNGNIPNTIEYIFKQSGVQIEDENNLGVYYPRLDMFAAINYEENKPVVTLETANESVVAPGTVILEYNVTDQHEIQNCSLYIDNVLNQTDSSVTRGVTQSFSVDFVIGNYDWRVECNDTATISNEGISETNSITVITVDSEAPAYSSLSATPNTYALLQNYTLNATWTDNVGVDEVIIQFEGVNYTDAVKTENVYTKTFTDLPAGTYNYAWYANDTSGNENNTGVQVFTINKATTVLSWTITPLWNVTVGTQTEVGCAVENPNNSLLKVYRDGINVSNLDIDTLGVGTYDYVCNTTGNENYTSNEITNTLTITNKIVSTATLTFDKVSPQTYGNTIKVTCTEDNPEAPAQLFRDGVDVTAIEDGVNVTLGAGTYNYTCNVSETTNYLGDSNSSLYTIDQSPTTITLDAESWILLDGTQTNVNCTADNSEVLVVLTMNGTPVSNPNIQTIAVGIYNYTCSAAATQNYTGNSDSNILTVSLIPDITPPLISNVVNSSITNDSITITWDTDENADSEVNYGTASGTYPFVALDITLVLSHSSNIANLQPNTTYYYIVKSRDASNNVNQSMEYNFTTLENIIPNQPPVLSGIPDNETDEDITPILDWIDLWNHVSDSDNTTSELTFTIVSNSNPSLIDCFVNSDRYVRCSTPSANQSGFTDINISVFDGEYYDYDTFRVSVNPIDDASYWNTLFNQNVNEDSADNTIVYPNLESMCIDIDSLINMTITSTHTNYDLSFEGDDDLRIFNLTADWFGTETVNLDCNGILASFDFTVNDVAEITCYQVCSYGQCYEICE